jgi:fucose permease
MFVVSLAYLAFFSIALPDSTLGVAWPSMRLAFGQPLSAAGIIPPIGVAATLVSTSLAPYLAARFGVGRVLSVGTLLSAAALTGSALSATWWQFLLTVVASGLAAGAIDATLNAYAARQFGPRRISLLHASYGVGAAVSPLVVTVVIATGASWRLAYLIISALLFAVAVVFTVNHRRWQDDPAPVASAPAGENSRPARVWTVNSVAGLLNVAVQTGIESSVALWAFTFLTQHLGVATAVAGGLASGYWLTLVIGRVAFGSLAERIGAWPVLAIATGLLVGAGILANVPDPTTAMVAVVLFGLACAPIYPLLILTTAERTSPAVADRVVGFQAAASSVGAAVLPGLVGLAMGYRVSAFAPALAVLCGVAAGLHLFIRSRRGRPA